MAYGWKGELVRLVPLDMERHFENALKWINDPEVTATLAIGDFPMGRLQEQEYFERHSKGTPDDLAFAIESLDGRHLGFSGIHRIAWHHRRATTGTFIGEPSEWGKGYGTDAALIRTRYAFEVLNLRLLTSEFLAMNERSRGMQRKVGYVEYGIVPGKYWKRGAYVDAVQTYCTLETFSAAIAERTK